MQNRFPNAGDAEADHELPERASPGLIGEIKPLPKSLRATKGRKGYRAK
jgi:hypothetical protein